MHDLLNKFFLLFISEPISKIHYTGGRLCHQPALWFRGGGRTPVNKDSHLCWHKIAGGCTNAFWPQVKIVSGLVWIRPVQRHFYFVVPNSNVSF
jgi:hypothetical protein